MFTPNFLMFLDLEVSCDIDAYYINRFLQTKTFFLVLGSNMSQYLCILRLKH